MSRTVRSIDSSWEFRRDIDPDNHWTRVNLPHCWNTEDLPDAGTRLAPIAGGSDVRFAGYGTNEGRDYYRGVGHYRKTLPALSSDNDQRTFLRFEGANQDAVVTLNGTQVGRHLGGYTAFCFDITPWLRSDTDNTLEVTLSNAHNPEVPPIGGDLGHFGGIYRSVSLMHTSPVHFDLCHYGSDGVFWQTPSVTPEQAELSLTARLVNHQTDTADITWSVTVQAPSGETVYEHTQPLSLQGTDHCTVAEHQTVITTPSLWSPDTPNVYRITHRIIDTTTGAPLDVQESPLGFRWFSIDKNTGFHLNGKHCFLRGVGRHQDYPGLGYAVPSETLAADTRRVKSMGANAMRSHYPLCNAVYEECDHSGLMAWAKIPVMDKMNESATFLDNARTMFTELILQMGTHPAVIFWGYACEILGDADWFWDKPQDPGKLKTHFETALSFCRALDDLAKELDPQRLTMNDFHSDPNPQWYRDSDLTEVNDINGWNIYHGWYHRNLDEAKSWLEDTRAFAPDRPYMLAEFGAGVDERIHAHEPSVFDFSPEYSARFHAHYRRVLKELPWVAGMFIWTWSDFQRTSLGDTMKHLNNKGMLANDRTPKDAYYQYRAWWTEEPMVRIAGHRFPRRAGVGDGDGRLHEKVRVFSNETAVELLVNGKSLGQRDVVDGQAAWECELQDGENQLVARSERAVDTLTFTADVYPADLKTWNTPGRRLCVNVGQARFSCYDEVTDTMWVPDRTYTEGGFGHVDGEYFRSWPDSAAWDGIRDGTSRHVRGAENQAMYQSFLVGVTEYRFDVAPGPYEVTLHWCEPFAEQVRKGAAVPHGGDSDGCRVFDVALNDVTVFKGLNLAEQRGELSAVTETAECGVEGDAGLSVRLVSIKGKPVLSGAELRRL